MTEIWKSIPNSNDAYEVSSEGRVRSVDKVLDCADGRRRKFAGKILACTPTTQSYPTFKIGKQTVYVHHVVCEAFHGPRPLDHEACHKNGVPADNQEGNLYWGTASENQLDRRLHGTSNGKLDTVAVKEIRRRYKPHDPVNGGSAMAREFGVSKTAIFALLTLKTHPVRS